jgi:hypothetical protein
LKPDGNIGGILSQSSVVRYLFDNRKQFPEIDEAMNKTVSIMSIIDGNSSLMVDFGGRSGK